MKARKLVLIGAGLLAAVLVTRASADYVIKDANQNTKTVFSYVCFVTKICPAMVMTNSAGVEVGTASNPARVDPTGTTTQPAGGVYNLTPPTLSSGQMAPLQFDSAGNLKITGLGGGGTSSSFGSAFPGIGTAIGAKNGVNMVNLTADPSGNLNINCSVGCSSSTAITGWGGGTLGAMANYGTSPGAVLVPGVNAFITNSPTVNLAAAAPVNSAATESGHVLKASAGSLYTLNVSIGATSGWVMVFNSATVPADGAVTPAFCRYVKSDGTGGATTLAWANPLTMSTGISAAFSSTGCFTKTASATAFFSAQVQ